MHRSFPTDKSPHQPYRFPPSSQKLLFLSHVLGSSCHSIGEGYSKVVSDQDEVRGYVPDQPIAVRTRCDGVFVLFDTCSKASMERLHLHQYKCPLVLVAVRGGSRIKEREVPAGDIEAMCKRHHASTWWVEVDLETGENGRAALLLLVKSMVDLRDKRDPLYVRSGVFPSFAALRRVPRTIVRRHSAWMRTSSNSLMQEAALGTVGAAATSVASLENGIFQLSSVGEEVWKGNVAGIAKCLKMGMRVDEGSGSYGDSPLHLAVFLNNADVVTFLMSKGASPWIKNVAGQTPLHVAAEFASLQICKMLVETQSVDADAVDAVGMTPLFYAIKSGRANVATYLSSVAIPLSRVGWSVGSSGNVAVSQESLSVEHIGPRVTAAHIAAAANSSAQFWREAALDLTPPNVIDVAASFGHVVALDYLLQNGKYSDGEVQAAFVIAAEEGHVPLLDLMWAIREPAVSTVECMSRALVRAVMHSQQEVANWLLLREKALFAEAAATGEIVISAAASLSEAVVSRLCEIVGDVNVCNEQGMTPILAASAHGRLKTLHLLIERGASLFARDKYDYGALHLACANDNTGVLESLLDLGLNPNEHNKFGESPLMVAVGQGNESVLRIVLTHLARKPPRDPLGTLKLWPKGPYLQAVLELQEKEFVEQRVIKWLAGSADSKVVTLSGTYMGLNVLARRYLAPVDTKELAFVISLQCHLRHRNLLGLLGVLSDGASYTLLFEVPGGGPLFFLDCAAGKTAGCVWSTSATIALCRELLRGLTEMHREGAGKPMILHRDMQLSSVLMNQKNGPMVCFFEMGTHGSTWRPTGANGCVGPRGWRPPECHRGMSFDAKSDVFLFAAMLYELREGKYPFSEYHLLDVPRKLVAGDRPKLSPAKTPLDAWFVGVIESCWQQNPDDRPTFAELSKRFDRAECDQNAQEQLEQAFLCASEAAAAVSSEGLAAAPSVNYLGPVPNAQVSELALQVNDNVDFGGEAAVKLPFVSTGSPESAPAGVADGIGSAGGNGGGGGGGAAASDGVISSLGTSGSNASGGGSGVGGGSGAMPSTPTGAPSSDRGVSAAAGTQLSLSLSSSVGGSDSNVAMSSEGGAGNIFVSNNSNAVTLVRLTIEYTEYYARGIPLKFVQARRLQLAQMRVLDIARLSANANHHRGANHVLRILMLRQVESRLQILTHRYDYVLFDRIRYMAQERKMHWSPEQVRSMALQIALGMLFINESDPPLHFCLSDKDIFIAEDRNGAQRVMIGGFGIVYMITAKNYAGMLGERGFIDASLLSCQAHLYNTVTDRNHRLKSEATDVFSFGMLLRTILGLRRPYEGEGNANDCVRQGMPVENISISSGYAALLDLSMACVGADKNRRPRFAIIVQRLEKMTNLPQTGDKYKPKVVKLRSSFLQPVLSAAPQQMDLVDSHISVSTSLLGPSGVLLLKSSSFNLECGAFLVSMSAATTSEAQCVLQPDACTDDYRFVFASLPHACLYGVGPGGPCLVIVSKVKGMYDEEPVYRALVRSQTGDERCYLPASTKLLMPKKGQEGTSPLAAQLLSALRMINNKFEKINFSVLRELCSKEDIHVLTDFENVSLSRAYSFGVIYAKKGQTDLSEMLANDAPSRDFSSFLACVGEVVRLRDFSRFAGGLDTKYDSTGEESVYARTGNCEVMLRVSTMLPLDVDDAATNTQRLKNRFLSQCVCLIVFQDEGSGPVSPEMLSHWPNVHVVLIVRPVAVRLKQAAMPHLLESFSRKHSKLVNYYQVAVASNSKLKPFRPDLENPVFQRGHFFKNWLLTKLINGERSAYQSDTRLRASAEAVRAQRLSALEHKLQVILEMPEVSGFVVSTSKEK